MAKQRAVNPEYLSDEVQKILKKYEDDLVGDLDKVTKSVANKGVKKIQALAKDKFPNGSGEYASGWAVTTQQERLVKTAVIHHKTMPGLPHLLEHGHVGYMYGRRIHDVKGREHIAPVEKEIVELYEREVISKI